MAYFWENKRWVLGSILLSFLTLKPQIGIPIMVLLLIWLWLGHRYSSIIAAIFATIALILIGFIKNINWITDFLDIGAKKVSTTFGYNPTLWGVSAFICQHNKTCTFVLGSAACIILLIWTYHLLGRTYKLKPSIVISIAITVAILVTPYIWAYDQILLIIPIVVSMLSLSDRGYPYLFTAPIFLFFSALALIFIPIGIKLQVDVWSVGVSLAVLCLLSWVTNDNG
jgi:hypothetical protein